jgi:ElaA protein
MILDWQVKHFSEISIIEFHDLMALRIKIFVVEQNCPYQEIDGKDIKSHHLIGRNDLGNIVATARILPQGLSYKEVSIGRVAIDESAREKGNGHVLMVKCMEYINQQFGPTNVRLSAQSHLEKYYQKHGFESTGKEYLEDDIPHVEMLFELKK